MEAMNCEPINPTPTARGCFMSDLLVGAQGRANDAHLGSKRAPSRMNTSGIWPPGKPRQGRPNRRPVSPASVAQTAAEDNVPRVQGVRQYRDVDGKFGGRRIDD